MQRRFDVEQLDVQVVAERRRPQPVPVASAPWAFAAVMAISIAVAVFGGLVLGLLAVLERGFPLEHWTRVVQAHGTLQLNGWVAVFVVALAFEFVVRLNQRPPFPLRPRVVVLVALGGGALLEAAGRLAGSSIPWAAGGFLFLLGAGGFAWMVFRVKPPVPLASDPHPLWFRTAAVWLTVAALLSFVSSFDPVGGVAALPETRLVTELFLRGFVLCAILAVALRAFPGHLGLPLMPARRQAVLLVAINASLVPLVLGSGAFGLPDVRGLLRAADIALGATILLATGWLGLVQIPAGITSGPRYRWLAPVAWLGAVAYAVALVVSAAARATTDLTLYQEGALRHIFMLGFMAPLMVTMAHVVLERFGTGRLHRENWLTAAFILLVVAWPLRVIPVLVPDAPGDGTRHVLSTAGVLTIAGLALLGAAAAANAAAIRAHVRARLGRS
jgi:hypothetical protein